MSYIDDYISDNAGRMTHDQIVTGLRGAGYDDREIKAALRRAPRQPVREPDTSSSQWSGDMTAARPAEGPDQAEIRRYMLDNRDRYPRETLTGTLLKAGHDRQTIDAAWAELDAAAQSRAARSGRVAGQRWGWIASAVFFGLILLATAGFIPNELFFPLMIVVVIGGYLVRLVANSRRAG